MGYTLQQLTELRNDPQYLNFIAVGEMLRLFSDGLRHYAELKAKELQDFLLKNLVGRCNCLCTAGVKPCRHTCTWSKNLEKLHVNYGSKKKSYVRFYQSDHTVWHDPVNGFWEIAKVFMHDLGLNWRDVKDPGTTDLSGLLNFLIFCKNSKVDPKLLTSVRDLRNNWAHTKNYKFSSSEKQDAFTKINNLMNDFELLSCKEVQDYRQRIIEIKSADTSIVLERDLEVLKELTRQQEFIREEELMSIIKLILTSKNHTQHDYISAYPIGIVSAILWILFFPVKVLKECCRWKMLPYLIMVMLLLSHVSDESVFVSEFGKCKVQNMVSKLFKCCIIAVL